MNLVSSSKQKVLIAAGTSMLLLLSFSETVHSISLAPSARKPVGEEGNFPVNQSMPFVSYTSVTFDVPDRPMPLGVKVSMPVTGANLPIILLSHGHGETNYASSLHGYGLLADFWAAHGFVVIQPTHLDSKVLGLRSSELPDAPTFFTTA
ncbi:hypothetical protein [Breoghania sp.]|uniref:hypothetical protein n=1 Tax=Breoghania sp. TaxID=2065378 RepID=UPI00260808D4|nr:hypothetical protein [Breoghania sp.]MDJ0930335.1 hypothetical protein [Breoghania sp.]